MAGGFWRNTVAIATIAWFSPVHGNNGADRMASAQAASGAWLEQAASTAGAELARRTLAATVNGTVSGEASASPPISAAARRELERLATLAARGE